MVRAWSKVTKLVQAMDGSGLVELLCKQPYLKPEKSSQVIDGLGSLPASRVLSPLLTAAASGRIPDGLQQRMDRLLKQKCQEEGVANLLDVVRADPMVREHAATLIRGLDHSLTLQPLLDLVNESEAQLRRWMRDLLRDLPRDLVIKPLLKMLEGPVRSRPGVVETLGYLGEVTAIGPLIVLLKKARGPLIETVELALAGFGQQVVEPLLEVLAGRVKRERELALAVLERLGELPLNTRVKIHLFMAEEEQLKALGAEAFTTLMEALSWPDPRHRFLSAKVLGGLGEELSVEPLMGLLKDGDPPVRYAALEALGRIGDTRAMKAMVAALEDQHEEVGRTAAAALGRLGQPGLGSLIGSLDSDNTKVRARAGRALLNLGAAAVEPLWGAYTTGEANLANRVAALLRRNPDLDEARRVQLLLAYKEVNELGKLGGSALPHLLQALGSDLAESRQTARKVLAKLGDMALLPLLEALSDPDLRVRQQALKTLAGMGKPALEGLMDTLKRPEARLRRDSARALGALRRSDAVPALVKALFDGERRVAHTAAEALVEVGGPGIKALGESGCAWGVAPLARLIDEGHELAPLACQALARLGKSARIPLETALGHQQPAIRQAAATALGELGLKASASSLIKALADEIPEVHEAARHSLTRLGRTALPALKKALNQREWQVRREACRALGELGIPETIPELVERLKDSDTEVQLALTRALINFGKPAIPALVKAMDKGSLKVQQRSREILSLLARNDLEALLQEYLGHPVVPLKAILWELAPAGWVGREMEKLGRTQEAIEWYISTGKQKEARKLKRSLAPASKRKGADKGSKPTRQDLPGVDEQTKPAPPRDIQFEVARLEGLKPTDDLSAQLQRLILAHHSGGLTDEEFSKAKQKLLD